jgi:hypothetical protein
VLVEQSAAHSKTLNFVTRPLARLGLARAYAISGDNTKAKTAYQDFFMVWKDADAEIRVLIMYRDPRKASAEVFSTRAERCCLRTIGANRH